LKGVVAGGRGVLWIYRPLFRFTDRYIILSTVFSIYRPYFHDIDRSSYSDKFRTPNRDQISTLKKLSATSVIYLPFSRFMWNFLYAFFSRLSAEFLMYLPFYKLRQVSRCTDRCTRAQPYSLTRNAIQNKKRALPNSRALSPISFPSYDEYC
jgi:hypothetical protein